jgi:hypothetical protein
MSLSARLIAIQGIGFSPLQVAVQGLLDYIAGGGKTLYQDTDQGVAGNYKPSERNFYAEHLNRQAAITLAREIDEEEAIIMTLVQFTLQEA